MGDALSIASVLQKQHYTSLVHSKFFHLWRSLKKGLQWSVDWEINLFRVAVVPVNLCTVLGFWGGCRSFMALIWSGLTSIQRWEIMYPRKLLELTPKEHLEVLRLSLCFLSTENTLPRSLRCSETYLLFTTMSSMYVSTFCPSWDSNILITIL